MQDPDLAFAERDQPYPGELQALEERGNVFLIAGEAVERFRDDDIEPRLAGPFEQRLISRPKRRRAAHRRVAVNLDHCPALARDPLLAEPNLVVDRGRALLVGRITGV